MFLLEKNMVKTLPMMRWIGETKIDFIGKAIFFVAISIMVIALGLTATAKKKNEAFGIDFAGGQVQEYHFARPVDAEGLRTALKEAKVKDAVIQQFSDDPNKVIIRTSEETYDQVQAMFRAKYADNAFQAMRIEKVGPAVGQHLRKQAMWAMILALLGIMIYVGFRFKHVDFAAAGVIALIHDVVIAFGLTVMFGRQIDLLVITALLTIAGYSINDTIVIYDRVRENMAKMGKKMPLAQVINLSINQTLGRTLLTSFATMLVVVAFFFLGGEVLNTFSLTLIIGFMAGVYSTVYIVSPIVVWWQKLTKTSW
jgi:preprotein translocase SecF subunit